MCKAIIVSLIGILAASSSYGEGKSKEAAVLSFVAEKLNQDKEAWDFQANPPKAIVAIDAQNIRDFRAHLLRENPELLRTILANEATAKYMTVLVFKNRAGTLYKVIHYLERDNDPCKNLHEIEFRNYNLKGGSPETSNIVSGVLADSGECPPTY